MLGTLLEAGRLVLCVVLVEAQRGRIERERVQKLLYPVLLVLQVDLVVFLGVWRRRLLPLSLRLLHLGQLSLAASLELLIALLVGLESLYAKVTLFPVRVLWSFRTKLLFSLLLLLNQFLLQEFLP